ncbi:MAG: ABC transporter substrate-binding protein [Candidatus Odyssella sp.]|nr:ABC transporter substrate-binding protein [Candidatus Odyssella sp.]
MRALATLAIVAAMLAAPVHAQAPAKPQRIVSLNVCVDQLLLLLVEPRRIAALTQFATDPDWSNMPREARGFRTTHGRAEEVVPLAPDLVIGGEYSAPDTIALLRRVGRRVEVMRLAHSIAGVRAGMRWMGAVVVEPEKAAALVAELDRRLAAVAAAVPPGPRPVLAFYNASGYTAEPGTLADDVIRAAGFDNLAGRLGLRVGGRLSLEQVAIARIDALIAADTAATSASRAVETVRHPALARIAARRPFAAIPGRLWTCETPFVAEAAERLAHLRAETGRRP